MDIMDAPFPVSDGPVHPREASKNPKTAVFLLLLGTELALASLSALQHCRFGFRPPGTCRLKAIMGDWWFQKSHNATPRPFQPFRRGAEPHTQHLGGGSELPVAWDFGAEIPSKQNTQKLRCGTHGPWKPEPKKNEKNKVCHRKTLGIRLRGNLFLTASFFCRQPHDFFFTTSTLRFPASSWCKAGHYSGNSLKWSVVLMDLR